MEINNCDVSLFFYYQCGFHRHGRFGGVQWWWLSHKSVRRCSHFDGVYPARRRAQCNNNRGRMSAAYDHNESKATTCAGWLYLCGSHVPATPPPAATPLHSTTHSDRSAMQEIARAGCRATPGCGGFPFSAVGGAIMRKTLNQRIFHIEKCIKDLFWMVH